MKEHEARVSPVTLRSQLVTASQVLPTQTQESDGAACPTRAVERTCRSLFAAMSKACRERRRAKKGAARSRGPQRLRECATCGTRAASDAPARDPSQLANELDFANEGKRVVAREKKERRSGRRSCWQVHVAVSPC